MRHFYFGSAVLAIALAFGVLSPATRAQSLTKWTASDPLEDEEFGAALDIDGAVAIVGAQGDNDPVINTGDYGAAHVFRFDGSQWMEEAKLTAPQRDFLEMFGRSVAIDGDVVLVGTVNDEDVPTSAGAVYVFRHDGSSWLEEAKWIASDGASGESFGFSLDLVGDVAVAGAPGHTDSDFGQGAVYVFGHSGGLWTEDAKLTASDPAVSAKFGMDVSLSGSRMLVGASGDSPPTVGQNAGAAYIFEHDGSAWMEVAKIAAQDTSLQAGFGQAVALDGDVAVVGAPLDDELGGGAGAAYVFRYDGSEWLQEAKLLPSDHSGFNQFGTSVAIDGDQIVVGAENWFPEGEDATGKAYVFRYNVASELWEEETGLVPDDAGTGDEFGHAVAVDNGVILVGSPDHGLPVAGAGAAYSYGEPVVSAAEHLDFPDMPRLSSPYPNPFRRQAALTLTLPRQEKVRISLFDLLGREVRLLHDGIWPALSGREIVVSASGLPSGVYVVRVAAGTFVSGRAVTLLQ